MAHMLFQSENFVAYEMRGGGIILRRQADLKEVFFQPGDDAATMRESIEAIEELSENVQEEIFDIACDQYF